jgi:2-keto-4-pentenoate hydratase/2-oxohepta-3-ene-1,7-dioic acid hydratase in catechol pathway
MRLASFIHDGRATYGVVMDDGIAPAASVLPDGPPTLVEAMASGLLKRLAAGAAGARRVPLADVKLLAPIPQPTKVIGLAVNYVEHHNEFERGHAMPDDPRRTTTPRPFIMPATTVIGSGDVIPWPVYSQQIDHEVELAVVIGRPCSRVSPAQARQHVAGYTIANDVSARSVTHADGRQKRPKDDFFDWLHGKWADGFCPLGPWLVTADEIPDPHNLRLQCLVNGDIRQDSTTRNMIFSVDELVSFCSQLMTLLPGDVIATGTPSGVAMATGKWLKGGDVITCRIAGIGDLTNTLGQPPESFYRPCRP